MYVRPLEYLLAIADTGSFGRAAERCGVTQPTLSAQIARLEAELDAQLIERTSRGTRLTPVGQRAVDQAAVVIDAVMKLRRLCQEQGHTLAGRLELGIIPTAGPYLMPRLMPVIRRDFPNAKPVVQEETTQHLLHRLSRGELDAAILALPVPGTQALASEPIMDEVFVAALPPGHALARRKRLGREDLADEPMLMLKEGHCLREQTAAFCQINPDSSTVQGTSVEGLKQMVSIGMGCTVLPMLSVDGPFARTAELAIVPFKPPVPSRRLALVWRESHPFYGALRELAKAFAGAMGE